MAQELTLVISIKTTDEFDEEERQTIKLDDGLRPDHKLAEQLERLLSGSRYVDTVDEIHIEKRLTSLRRDDTGKHIKAAPSASLSAHKTAAG